MQTGSMQKVRRRQVCTSVCNAEPARKGAWLIHVVLITLGKIVIDFVPGMTQQISWTLVNLFYLAVSR